MFVYEVNPWGKLGPKKLLNIIKETTDLTPNVITVRGWYDTRFLIELSEPLPENVYNGLLHSLKRNEKFEK